MKLNKPLQILFLLLISLQLFSNDKVQKTFNELYGKDYTEIKSSPVKDNKIAFSNKLIENSKAVQDENLKYLVLYKAHELTNDFVAGYPTAIKALEEILTLENKNHLKDILPKTISLNEDLLKANATIKGDEKTEIQTKILGYQIDYAQLLYQAGQIKDTMEILKKIFDLSKDLNFKKTEEKVSIYQKALLQLLQSERSLEKLLPLAKSKDISKETFTSIGEHYLLSFGLIKKAIPYLINSNREDLVTLASYLRQMESNNTQASKNLIFFKERDLDLPDWRLIHLLHPLYQNNNDYKKLISDYVDGNLDAIIGILKLVENEIDGGERTYFTDAETLIKIINELRKECKSINAQKALTEACIEGINVTLFNMREEEDLKKEKLNIHLQEQKAIMEKLESDPQNIQIKQIPRKIKKPNFKTLTEDSYIAEIFALENVVSYGGKNIADFKKVQNYAKLFHIDIPENKTAPDFNTEKWSNLNIGNGNTFTITRKTEEISLIHFYIHSQVPQKGQIRIKGFGRVFFFLNGKNYRLLEDGDWLYSEVILLPGENLVRIPIFSEAKETTKSQLGIRIIPIKKDDKLDLKTSTFSYRQ